MRTAVTARLDTLDTISSWLVDRSGNDPLASVEILTDEDGVSHIYADDLYTLSYANGYVQARDRLFQLDALRHVGYGDSAKLLGLGQLQSDLVVRRDLYTREELETQFENASERIQLSLRGFANGVNRQLIEMVTTGSLPAEFVGLGHVPELWDPVDSVAVIAYMLGFFGVFGGNELDNARRFARLCETMDDEPTAFEAYGDLNWTRVPEEQYTSIPAADLTAADLPVGGGNETLDFDVVPDKQLELARATAAARPWGTGAGARANRDVTLPDDLLGPASDALPGGVLSGVKWGSNALAVHGDLTETGRPMLFGGPQMGYFKPPIIHEIGLHGAGFDVVGIGVAGVPSVIIGRTPEFAWSVTSGYDDQVDTVVIDLHPTDRHRYQPPGVDDTGEPEWREMDTETVTHRASVTGALADDKTDTAVRILRQEIARVEIGGDRHPVVAWNPEKRIAWAQRTTTRGDELDSAFAWSNIGRQNDFDGFCDCLTNIPFSYNFIYADSEDIAYVHTGRVPERNPNVDQRFPVHVEDHEWQDMTDGTDLGIHVKNPSRGYVAQWNNAPITGWRAGDTEQRWGHFHRVDLLDAIVRDKLGLDPDEGPDEATETLSVADMQAIIAEAATYDPLASATTPQFIEVAADCDDKRLQWMADELASWARVGYPWRDEQRIEVYDDPGHAIWDETRKALQELVFEPFLGDLTPELQLEPPNEIDPDGDEDPHAGDHGRTIREVTLVSILRGEADGDWLDGDEPADVIQRALYKAADRLEDRFGTSDPTAWRLPEHKTEFLAIGVARPDTMDMVNRGSFNHIVALGDPGEPALTAKSILPPSNSGHIPLSKLVTTYRGNEPDHLTDQLERYKRFAYKPMPVQRAAVERRATDRKRLWLRPDQSVGLLNGLGDTLLGAGLSLLKDF